MKKTSVFSNGLIWFGAAVSIAEIEAGYSIGGNWPALIAGHLLGGLMLFAAGLIGARTGKNAMETTAGSFGKWGLRLFSILNIIQLAGWTAVMIAQGGEAVSELANGLPYPLVCAALTLLIGIWLFIAFADRFRLATFAMAALALLAIWLTLRLIGTGNVREVHEIGFWPAFEISAAMPLSWIPLISDYTSKAERPQAAAAVSATIYTVASIWMYALGILLSENGATSVADGIAKSGLGAAGLVAVVFSTVTTTFLDAYSAGESAKAIFAKAPAKIVALAVCAVGGILAVFGIMDHYMGFLFFISSVFAPMAAVLLADRYLVKEGCTLWNIAAWLIGLTAYQLAGNSPIGPTLTSITLSAAVVLVRKLFRIRGK